MALAFYDSSQTLIDASNPIRTSHNGFVGESDEVLFHIRNDSTDRYYEEISVEIEDLEGYGTTPEYEHKGWSFKLLYGSRRPTEKEWDMATSMAPLLVPDLGDDTGGDDTTYLPIWLRIYVPGGTRAQYRPDYSLKITAIEKVVP
jgi:hypothetical protein